MKSFKPKQFIHSFLFYFASPYNKQHSVIAQGKKYYKSTSCYYMKFS